MSLVGSATAAEQDGAYTGTVTSVRAIPCNAWDFTPSIAVADGVASLVYLPNSVGRSVVLHAGILRNGIFAAESKGEFAINLSGTVSRSRIEAKAWAWNCECALTMQKSDRPGGAATASLPK